MTAAAWICLPKIRPPSREAKAKFWASVFFSHQRVCVCGHCVGNTSTRPHSRSAVGKQATGSNMFKSSPLNWRRTVEITSLCWLTATICLTGETVSDGEVRSPAAFLLIGSQLLENRRSLTHEHKHDGQHMWLHYCGSNTSKHTPFLVQHWPSERRRKPSFRALM